jgi:hypothetical protein
LDCKKKKIKKDLRMCVNKEAKLFKFNVKVGKNKNVIEILQIIYIFPQPLFVKIDIHG